MVYIGINNILLQIDMIVLLCMPTFFSYGALCPTSAAEILIRRKLPAAAGAENLLICSIQFGPRRFRASGTAACAKHLVRQQFPAAVGAKHLLCGVALFDFSFQFITGIFDISVCISGILDTRKDFVRLFLGRIRSD